ncbi:hypothetical protein A0H81_11958 [Grifola frondosa]|uniref:SAP domain-containing protein n=1 Tax=Grifola frondosa TaxID=5627 RepID=A0A1C7LVB4_GRIFR|nr:hypothetical protein A0H81_11958 [Grifola frondosa]
MPKINTNPIVALQLPRPGQTLHQDRRALTYEFTITPKTTVKVLKETLASHGLAKSGNRSELIQRLSEFAAKDDEWIGAEINNVGFPSKHQSDEVQRVVRPLTDAESEHNDSWADTVLKSNERPRTHRVNLSDAATNSGSIVSEGNTPPLDPGSYAAITARRMEREVRRESEVWSKVLDKLHDIDAKIVNTLVSHASQSSGSSGRVEISVSEAADTSISDSAFPSAPSPPIQQPAAVPVASRPSQWDQPNSNLKMVILGNEEFTFDKTQVPDPPLRHFSKDISCLFREWEDSELLKVHGRPIPVKYWSVIYKKSAGAKAKAWAAMKKEWGNWKYLVDEKVRLGSEDAFWREYTSSDGTRFRYQQILNCLKNNRKHANAQDAATAQAYFNNNLGREDAQGVFAYSKSRSAKVCTKEAVIARKWRKFVPKGAALVTQEQNTLERQPWGPPSLTMFTPFPPQ